MSPGDPVDRVLIGRHESNQPSNYYNKLLRKILDG